MQKVEGSSPFIRFERGPRFAGLSRFLGEIGREADAEGARSHVRKGAPRRRCAPAASAGAAPCCHGTALTRRVPVLDSRLERAAEGLRSRGGGRRWSAGVGWGSRLPQR